MLPTMKNWNMTEFSGRVETTGKHTRQTAWVPKRTATLFNCRDRWRKSARQIPETITALNWLLQTHRDEGATRELNAIACRKWKGEPSTVKSKPAVESISASRSRRTSTSKTRVALRIEFVTDNWYVLTEHLKMAAGERIAAPEAVGAKRAKDRETGLKHRWRTRQGRLAGQGQDTGAGDNVGAPKTTDRELDQKIGPACGQAGMSIESTAFSSSGGTGLSCLLSEAVAPARAFVFLETGRYASRLSQRARHIGLFIGRRDARCEKIPVLAPVGCVLMAEAVQEVDIQFSEGWTACG
ncbi:MAG: hypothetical protein F4114_02685 [Rhodospirillaceae bacterium]|nr:hypothetical protein [Rhodospirillaceae bacterium]MYB12659.1 hypothetical protein [Rhodospirillaceae bacterium]MYI47981.1 hypothetical protein [Rhodospirillaceae bacterium]